MNVSQVFQTSIYLTHKLNETVNSSMHLTPPEIVKVASKLDLPTEDILLIQELVLTTYNNTSVEFYNPYYCQLWSVLADNSTKQYTSHQIMKQLRSILLSGFIFGMTLLASVGTCRI